MATREEDMIRRYFDAFNSHDLEAVMACFHPDPVVVDSEGRRHEGVDAVRRLYRFQFSVADDGRGMAESLFHGTLNRGGTVIKARGAEVFEFSAERIKEIRDHHRMLD